MINHPTPTEIATGFIGAWARRDMTTVSGYLAEDVVFESPRTRITGADSVVAELGQFAEAVIDVDILAVVGDARHAMIMYDLKTIPFGTLRAVDHLVVDAGRITSDVLVFDTYKVRLLAHQ